MGRAKGRVAEEKTMSDVMRTDIEHAYLRNPKTCTRND